MQWKKAWEGSSSRGWRSGLGRQGADCCLLFSDCKLRNCFSDLGVRHVMAQTVKTLPTMQETQVRSLGWEDPPGEGNDNPLQDSCSENRMDRGAWRAAVHGVTKSQARLSNSHTHTPRLTVLRRYCIFQRPRVCADPASRESGGAMFPSAPAHFMSVSRFGNSRAISNPLPAQRSQPEGSGDG